MTTLTEYEEHPLEWRGQQLTIRWCPVWLSGHTAHLQIVSADRSPHPISETGYRSDFCLREEVADAGGPVAYARAWLQRLG